MNFANGCQTRSFLLNRGSKRPPVFIYGESVTFEQLETSSICLNGGSMKWDNQYFFRSLEAMMYGARKWFQTSRKCVVVAERVRNKPRGKKTAGSRYDLNQRPSEYQSDALTII